jgi:hypothetical protein
MSKCKLQKGEISILVEEKLLSNDKTKWVKEWTVKCGLEEGTILRIPYDSDGIKPTPTPKRKEKPKVRKTKIVPKQKKPALKGEIEKTPEVEIKTTGGLEMAKKEKQELVATVEQPANDNVSAELMKLAKENSSDPIVTMVLAAMAVFGGGAAMKFYKQWAEQRHEEKMEKIKMESKGQDKSPGQCQAVHAQLTAQLTEVKAKVNSLDSRIDVDFDGDRLERRVKKLEKWKKDSEDDDN